MKVAIYLKHDETLGEVMRISSIARYLGGRGHAVLLIHAGKPFPVLEQAIGPAVQLLQLPGAYDDRYSLRFKVHHPVSAGQLITRIKAMTAAVEQFQPDAFITVGFPFSYEEGAHELVPFLPWLRQKFPWALLASSIGYPVAEFRPGKLEEWLARYDLVLVHCPRELDYERILRVQPEDAICTALARLEAQGKAVFTNYVLPEESRARLPAGPGDFMLLSRGSGIVNDSLIPAGIAAARALGMPCLAVLGASSDAPVPSAEPGLTYVQHLSQADFTARLAAARLSVSMAGYGTAVQLLWLRKSASVLVTKDVDSEQDYRAAMLKDLLGSVVLRPEGLNSAIVERAAREALAAPARPRVKDEWFTGLEGVARALEHAAGDHRRAHQPASQAAPAQGI